LQSKMKADGAGRLRSRRAAMCVVPVCEGGMSGR
jgi:hypothetical protein